VSEGDAVDVPSALAVLRQRGHRLILSEGGPTLFAALLAARAVDELFLTVSPVLAGRGDRPRPALVEGVELLPGHGLAATLRSLRRSGNHLFLRFAL
jgi:riboflavin biosynthesis pyrimidine reductase